MAAHKPIFRCLSLSFPEILTVSLYPIWTMLSEDHVVRNCCQSWGITRSVLAGGKRGNHCQDIVSKSGPRDCAQHFHFLLSISP